MKAAILERYDKTGCELVLEDVPLPDPTDEGVLVKVHADGRGLAQAATMLEERNVRPSINEAFALDEVNAALARVAQGKSKGKTILTVN